MVYIYINISEGFASTARPLHFRGTGLGAASEAFCESWGIAGGRLVLPLGAPKRAFPQKEFIANQPINAMSF